jgi:hypothetical protein
MICCLTLSLAMLQLYRGYLTNQVINSGDFRFFFCRPPPKICKYIIVTGNVHSMTNHPYFLYVRYYGEPLVTWGL